MFEVKLTPKDGKAVYSQSLQYLKKDFIVEQVYIITVLFSSNNASPIFAQRTLSGKLRLMVDLGKINNHISDDNTKDNHSISTLSGASPHLAGKQIFYEKTCSQACHCLQLANQRSIEVPAYNVAIPTFVYQRFAQVLSRSLSALSSFIREILIRVMKTYQCAQNVEDIGIAANTPLEKSSNTKAVSEWISKAGFRLTIKQCPIGSWKLEFPGRTVTPKGISPQTHKIQEFFKRWKFQNPKNRSNQYQFSSITIEIKYRECQTKSIPFYTQFKSQNKVPVKKKQPKNTTKRQTTSCSVQCRTEKILPSIKFNKKINGRRRFPLHWVRVGDWGQTWTKTHFQREVSCTLSFRFASFYTSISQSVYEHQKFPGQVLWQTEEATLVFTDINSVTGFQKTKAIPPAL